MIRHRLDDTTWNRIYLCLKATPGIYVGNEDKCRIFVDAVHWIMRTGAQWRDLPAGFGKWNTILRNCCQAEQALGKSVGGISTKIHATVDALGNPLRLLLTGGQRGDATQAIPLLEGFDFLLSWLTEHMTQTIFLIS